MIRFPKLRPREGAPAAVSNMASFVCHWHGIQLRRTMVSSAAVVCTAAPPGTGRGLWDLDDYDARETRRNARGYSPSSRPREQGADRGYTGRTRHEEGTRRRDYGASTHRESGREQGQFRGDRSRPRNSSPSERRPEEAAWRSRERPRGRRFDDRDNGDDGSWSRRRPRSFDRDSREDWRREGRRQPYGRDLHDDEEGTEYGVDFRDGGFHANEFQTRSGGDESYQRREGPRSAIQLALASEDDLLYGIAPVLAALRAGRRQCRVLYVQESPSGTSRSGGGPTRKPGHEQAIAEIHRMASALGLKVNEIDKGGLNALSGNRPHQGFVLQASAMEYTELSKLPKPGSTGSSPADIKNSSKPDDEVERIPSDAELHEDGKHRKAPVWLVLDEVTDPQNFGALLRTAHFLGAEGVIACRRNSSALSPVVSKASSGALEVMQVRGVTSMPRFLRAAAGDGWRVVGTAVTPTAIPLAKLETSVPTLVVLGSEGRGLRKMVMDSCNVLVEIERAGSRAAGDPVDSLNVSVAGAIVLHRLLL